jgi:Ribbon-helix-helix protein, copG family.
MQRTREYPIQIRVTESEKRRLQRNARACRMTLSAYMRTVGLGKSVSAFPADEVHTLYSGFCQLRDEYPYRDLDWIERQFEALTKQFHQLCAMGGGERDGSHENLAN